MILVPEKELINKSEEFLRNLKDSLPPFLEVIHKKISIGNVIRPPIGLPYFFIYLPQGVQTDEIAMAEIEQSIINFGGKFTMSAPLENVDAITVTLALKDVSEFRFKKTRNTYETITKNNTEIMKVKVTIKDFQDLKKEIKNFLKMLCLTDIHYSQIIPEADLTVEYGPVFLKEKAYADYVIAQAEKYKKLDGYVVARVGETKNVYFKIGFTNPLKEEQPLPAELTPVVTPGSVKTEGVDSTTTQATPALSVEKNETKKASNQLDELKSFLQQCDIRSGKYYNNVVLSGSEKFAVLNSVVEAKRQEIIDAFTKHNLFNCLELKEGVKSIRVDLAFFENHFPASGKNDAKVPVKSVAKKQPIKESKKIDNGEKVAALRIFIHSSGIVCGKHYSNISLNVAKTVVSINGIEADGPLRSEVISKFKEHGLLECLDTTSTEKSIKVDIELFAKSYVPEKKEAAKKPEDVVNKTVKKEDTKPSSEVFTPELLEKGINGLLEVARELVTVTKVLQASAESKPQDLTGITDQLASITKSLNTSAEAKWEMLGKKYAGDTPFEFLIRTKVDSRESMQVITKEEFIQTFS